MQEKELPGMTRDELQKSLDDIDARVKAARARYSQKWDREIDKMDWFERALELVDATGIDPLVALLQIDRDQPSDNYSFDDEVTTFKNMLDM